MTKEIFISSTPHETRLAIVEDEQLVEIHYERENEYTLAGSMYKGKVTRVLPGMQSAFVDVGLERDAFLYVTDFLEEQDDSGEYDRTALPPPARSELPSRSGEQSAAPLAEAGGEGEGEAESGSRRWRGRRGRRRGGRGREAGAPASASETQPLTEGITLEINSDDMETDAGHFAPHTGSYTQEFDSDENPPSVEEPADDWYAPMPHLEQAQAHNEPEPEQQERERRPRRDRERDRDRDEAPTSGAGNVLPGESLQKYGGTGARSETGQSQSATQISGVKPSTLVNVPIAWDGGATLPGESLSRHRRSETAAPRKQPARDSERSARSEAEIADLAPEAITEFVQEQPGPEYIEQPVEQDEFSEEEIEEGEASAPESYPGNDPDAESEDEQPGDASASHKVDPNPPTEFRLPWSRKDKQQDGEKHPRNAHELAHELATHTAPLPEVFPGVPDFVEDEDSEHGEGQDFAPGRGHVEEEVLEGEEFDYEPLHARHDDHDSDDLVEETVEPSFDGQIGDYVREAHVDERTGAAYDSEAEAEDDELAGEEEAGSATETAPASPRQRRGRRGRRGQQPAVAEQPEPRHDDRRRQNGQRRQSMQSTSLPAINELLKPGQEILVQIAKEPIAKKGARITSHIALPGRFLVYMPTVNHVGVSRKISSDEERQRLKRILLSEKADASGGFIVRTAAGSASEQELRADIRFLINLWNEIKQRSESAKPPALIYHDLNLVERILRDQVTDKFSAIWVDTEAEYERVVKFLNRFQPSLVRHVKLYSKETPLFEQFGIQEEVNKALKSKVWLKSGGSIVINQTEALVAIDINTGKYVGKTSRLEDTILKTNLDAIPEIVRQVRLRDLGGIIVIDFIDMDERRNRHKVMAALEEELKRDRAPSKVLQFNDFGLVAITRKRVKQSLERTLSMPCITCQGTGMVKNPTTVCNEIYVELRKMYRHLDRGDIMLRVHPEVVKQLKTNGSRWLQDMEEMAGLTIIIKSDANIHPEQFDIH